LTLRSQQGLGLNGWEKIQIKHAGLEQSLPAFSGFNWRWRGPSPVGDWWVDETLPVLHLAHFDLDLPSTFDLRTRFCGRFRQEMSFDFEADVPFRVSFRRGWINNDFFIKDGEGRVLAASSIDPRPGERIVALFGTLLGALAAACWCIGLWQLIFQRRAKKKPAPTKGGDKENFPVRLKVPSSAGSFKIRPWIFVVILALMALAAITQSVWMAHTVLNGLPHTPDEVVDQLQARWILNGHLTGELGPCPELEAIPFCYNRDGRLIGHYPPAWPLMLAPGVALGLPALVPALLHGLLIVLLGMIGRRLGGDWMGLGAALFALASPLAALLFSSTLSHAGSASLLALALFLVLESRARAESSGAMWCLIAAGASMGLAFGIRPLTSLAVGLPLVFFSLVTGESRIRWKTLASLGAGAVPFLILVFGANSLITGAWWRFSYSLAGGSMLSPAYLFEGLRNVDTLLASLPPLANGWLWPSFPTGLGLPLGIALIPFLLRRTTSEDRLLMAIGAIVLFSHLLVRANGLHGYGPRYLFAACIPLWLLQSRAFVLLAEGLPLRRRPAFASVAILLGLSALILLQGRLTLYRNYNDVDGRLHQELTTIGNNSLILVDQDNWRVWAEASPWLGLEVPGGPGLALDVLPLEDICRCRLDCRLFRWQNFEMIPLGECQGGELCQD